MNIVLIIVIVKILQTNAIIYFESGVKPILITFYNGTNYCGLGNTQLVKYTSAEGDPCDVCYNVNFEQTLPASISIPEGYYIRLYENYRCKGDFVSFANKNAECRSSHLDLYEENSGCYISNSWGKNFCPNGKWSWTSGFLGHDILRCTKSGLWSYSVHEMPKNKEISATYPHGIFGSWIGKSCPYLEYDQSMRPMPDDQREKLENMFNSYRKKRSLDPKKAELSCWCILLYYMNAMSVDDTLTQLNIIYEELNINPNYLISWTGLKQDNKFFGIPPITYWNDYQNLVYSSVIRLYKHKNIFLPNEGRHLLPYVSAVVNHRRYQQSRISINNQDVGHIRVLLLWEILEILIQSMINNTVDSEQTVTSMGLRLERLGFNRLWRMNPPIQNVALLFYFLLGLDYNSNSCSSVYNPK